MLTWRVQVGNVEMGEDEQHVEAVAGGEGRKPAQGGGHVAQMHSRSEHDVQEDATPVSAVAPESREANTGQASETSGERKGHAGVARATLVHSARRAPVGVWRWAA